jgi:hypothetical protein
MITTRHIAFFLLATLAPTTSLSGQGTKPLSVAEATQSANQVGSKQVLVEGHFWWGKEGSMIYDSYYKAVLRVHYSDAFNAKHPSLDFFLPTPRRKSDRATVTGHLNVGTDGKLTLIADDIQFLESIR